MGQNPKWPPKLHISSYLCSQWSQKDDLGVYFRVFLVKDCNSDTKIIIKWRHEQYRGQNPRWQPKCIYIGSYLCSELSQKDDLGVYFNVFLVKNFNSGDAIVIKWRNGQYREQNPRWLPKHIYFSSHLWFQLSQKNDLGVYFRVSLSRISFMVLKFSKNKGRIGIMHLLVEVSIT